MSRNLQSPVLSETGLQFWVDQWVCDRSERGFKGELGSDGRNHLRMGADGPETWYPDLPRPVSWEIYQHQAFWDNR